MSNEVVRDLYAQLTAAYYSFEAAALDGARWQIGRCEWQLLQSQIGTQRGPDCRLLALPVEILDREQPVTLRPGPNGKPLYVHIEDGPPA